MPDLESITIDSETISEDGGISNLSAKISSIHSRDVSVPLNITGTARIDSDYSIEFDSKGPSIVAGSNSYGTNLDQLYHPHGVDVDSLGNIYVADWNKKMVCIRNRSLLEVVVLLALL